MIFFSFLDHVKMCETEKHHEIWVRTLFKTIFCFESKPFLNRSDKMDIGKRKFAISEFRTIKNLRLVRRRQGLNKQAGNGSSWPNI